MKKKKILTGSILFSKGLLESSTAPQFKGSNSFLFCRLYDLALTIIMTTGKTVALTARTFVDRVMFLLFNRRRLKRFLIAFLSRSKRILISWLWSSSAVILELKKRKSVITSAFFPSTRHEVMGPDSIILDFFYYLILSWLFHPPPSPSSRDSLVPLCFLPLEWYHLHI